MNLNKVILECKRVNFFSNEDKDAFFDWVLKISSIIECKGQADKILLVLENTQIPDQELKALVSLYRRYKIKTEPLGVFVNEQNRSWFYQTLTGYSICIYPS